MAEGNLPALFSSDLVIFFILPTLLVFLVVFGVLQKAEIFGKGRKQLDALISLVIGLMVAGAGYVTGLFYDLTSFLAIALVIILILMLMWGFLFKEGSFEIPKTARNILMIVILVALVIAVMVFTGSWDYARNYIADNPSILYSVLFLIVIGAAVAVVFAGAGNKPAK